MRVPSPFPLKGSRLMSQKVTLRSVIDGNSFTLEDDGHKKGNPSISNARRAAMDRMIEKRSPVDNGPVWFLAESQGPWREGDIVISPIKHISVWNAECDRRLAEHKAAREGRAEVPRPAPLPSRVEKAKKAIEHEEKKAAIEKVGTGEARAATVAGAVKAEA